MTPVIVTRGDSPVILAMPHGGTYLPDTIAAGLNDRGRTLADTDWQIDALYAGLLPGATTVQATFHRYVIDANRDPAGASLYPGQNTTGLCPETDFDGQAIWLSGQAPGPEDIIERRAQFHAPYHAALQAEVDRIHALHGVAIVYDCHSIRSNIPFLFPGQLAAINIGTNNGETCDMRVQDIACGAASDPRLANAGLNWVLNGRFKGGWTTRHYGQPAQSIHAIQMEIAQRAYLAAEAAPWTFDPLRSAPLRDGLGTILTSLDTLARSGDLKGQHHA